MITVLILILIVSGFISLVYATVTILETIFNDTLNTNKYNNLPQEPLWEYTYIEITDPNTIKSKDTKKCQDTLK